MLLNIVLFAFLATAVSADPTDFSYVKTQTLRMCEENNVTSDTLQHAKVYVNKFEECSPILAQYEQLPVDIESAIQNGTVDEVARRFCAKAEEIKSCRANFVYAMGSCMHVDTENYFVYIIKITNSTFDYICSEEHQKTILAKMVDEGVIQCTHNGTRGLSQCFNTLASPSVNLKAGFETAARCAVDKFKECSLVAGARAEDMFNYIYEQLSPLVETTVPASSAGLNKLIAF